MGKRIDLTGKRFERLTVLGFSHMIRNGVSQWHVKCDCGIKKIVGASEMKMGKTKSCGCLKKENRQAVKHGMFGTPTYNVWSNMKGRCLNKTDAAYSKYGGRGITICDKWMTFEGFYEDMGIKPKGMCIDRIDNDGNYTLDNCRWATMLESNNNKRNVIFYTYNGLSMHLSQWAKYLNISKTILFRRKEKGLKTENILTIPIQKKYRNRMVT